MEILGETHLTLDAVNLANCVNCKFDSLSLQSAKRTIVAVIEQATGTSTVARR